MPAALIYTVAVNLAVKPSRGRCVRSERPPSLISKTGVPGMGFEPIRSCELRFLRPLRLPLRHPGAESAMLVAG